MAIKKNVPFPFLIGVVIILAALVSFLFIPGLNTSSRTTRLTIHRGMGFRTILGELRRNGTIAESWPTLMTVSIIPKLHHIKPGRYVIPPGMSNFGLMYYLHSHPQDEVRVTLPEGLDLNHVARILSTHLDIDSTGFIAAASDRKLLAKYDFSQQCGRLSLPRNIQLCVGKHAPRSRRVSYRTIQPLLHRQSQKCGFK